MRDAFVYTLLQLAEDDSDILLLSGDLGFGVLDEFRSRFPTQFLNVGVAEQNLAGVGTGLALSGHRVLTYSIGNFPTFRCLEQLRNDACYHDANLTVVTVGGGMAYGALGPSHFATEDLGVMRMLPGMTVVAPGDPVEVRTLLPQMLSAKGPKYLRLGRAGEPNLVGETVGVRLGVPNVLHGSGEVLLASTGGMLGVSLGARDRLRAEGVLAAVVSVHTIRPFPEVWFREETGGFRLVVTVEEHATIGGLGGAAAEVMSGRKDFPPLLRFGLAPQFPVGVGSQEFLRTANGIDAEHLAARVIARLSED
jgi:transketolase